MSSDKLVAVIDGAVIDREGASHSHEDNQVLDPSFTLSVKADQYSLDDKIQFDCHKDIGCFNKCCKHIEIQLTPYDILRLKKHFEISSNEFVARFTFPFEMNSHGMPGLRLTHKPGSSECIFVTDEGCSVYEDRPTACRYYPLGNMGIRKKEPNKISTVFFIVKEDSCLGHNEQKTQTIREYLNEQGADFYDQYNEDWRDIIVKKRSRGSTIVKPNDRSMQLFDMCSYDIDSFREFIQTSTFLNLFDIDQNTLDILINYDEELLLFAMRFLKQVFFGKKTIPLKQFANEKHLQQPVNILQQKAKTEIVVHKSVELLEDWVDS